MFLRTAVSIIVLATLTPSFFAERVAGKGSDVKFWFIARVINTDPFTLEYVDTWSLHVQPVSKRTYRGGSSISENPQASSENVKNFRIGDMISGESCVPWIHSCPPPAVPEPAMGAEILGGEKLQPEIAINLKKLAGAYKTKYAKTGLLVYYKPHSDNVINYLNIYRDGTIELSSYSGWLSRKLSKAELKNLEKTYFVNRIDRLSSSKTDEYFKRDVTTVFGKFRAARFDYSSKESEPFTDMLDKLIESQLENADYRITYRWRFKIRDWEFGDVLPLDEAAKPGFDFIVMNRDRLLTLRPPTDFYEDARGRHGEIDKFFYKFKGKLYRFTFACTEPGSWACYFANETGKSDSKGKVFAAFDEWPEKLGVSLHEIPEDGRTTSHKLFGDGIAIPKADFAVHQKFYSQFLRTGGQFREGDFVYWDVRVWFK